MERRSYENWSRMIRVDDVLTATPTTDDEALEIVRWAADRGLRVRPVGAFHTWSPLAFDEPAGIVAIDQSRMTGLIDFSIDPAPAATFRAGTTLADALRELEMIDNAGASEAPGWAWPDYPGVREVTLGGMLAIGAHGAGVRTRADQADLFGTVSNLVLGFRAIVSEAGTYVIREFRRDDPDSGALLVHLGAAYLLSVTMRVVPNCYVGRRVEYPDWEVAYGPTAGEGSLQALVEEHGRVQALWFPFTKTPVVQHFTEEPFVEGPRVTEPLTVRLSPDLPKAFTGMFTQALAHLPWLTPLVERRVLAEMRHLSPPDQEWHGTSGNMLLYVQQDTLRVVSLAYAVHVRRDQLQEAVHALAGHFDRMLHDYAAAGHDPINRCLEMGALGFVPKSVGANEIVACMQLVLAGQIYRPDLDAGGGPSFRETLTRREEEIVMFCAEGLQNKEIGLRLGISDNTVRAHLAKIFKRFDLTSRADTKALVRRLGLEAAVQD